MTLSEVFLVACLAIGAILIATGCALISIPLGFIVGGVLVAAVGFLLTYEI